MMQAVKTLLRKIKAQLDRYYINMLIVMYKTIYLQK